MTPRVPHHVQTAIDIRLGLPLGLASGYAKGGHCPRCGLAVIAGYDSPACAGLAIVDPHTALPMEEAAAVILGLPTWELHGRPGRHVLSNRTWPGVPKPWPLKPADQVTVAILHRCGFRPLATGPPIPTSNSAHASFPDQPPF